MKLMMNFLVLTTVMESLKIQMRMIICWYLNMLKMEIYIIIYQKILKELLGNKKYNSNKIYRVIPYVAPEVLSKEKSYTKESDIYSFGMIMWEHTSGKKPFHDRSHNPHLIFDILNGERPQITNDTPEFYIELMK